MLSDPGSELRLGREKKEKREDSNEWGEQKKLNVLLVLTPVIGVGQTDRHVSSFRDRGTK